ncbi:MAG: hypothetical protein ABH862_00030, partial [Candidatus Omnitrophota bacterium]
MVTNTFTGRIDKVLLGAVIMIALLGIVYIYSATHSLDGQSAKMSMLVMKQAAWVLLGMLILFVLANTDYLRILNYAYFAYGLNIAALIFLLLFGGERYGA